MADGMACIAGQTCETGIQQSSLAKYCCMATAGVVNHEILYYTMQYHGILQGGSFNPILLGGGQICPHPHVFACTHVCMRMHVPIFCDFSSFLVCMKVQHIWPHKISPRAQDKQKLVKFT